MQIAPAVDIEVDVPTSLDEPKLPGALQNQTRAPIAFELVDGRKNRAREQYRIAALAIRDRLHRFVAGPPSADERVDHAVTQSWHVAEHDQSSGARRGQAAQSRLQ